MSDIRVLRAREIFGDLGDVTYNAERDILTVVNMSNAWETPLAMAVPLEDSGPDWEQRLLNAAEVFRDGLERDFSKPEKREAA